MSKQIDALKLALEFIERVNKDGWILADFEPQMYETITAIKEALAQPEQEGGVCGRCGGWVSDPVITQPEQEYGVVAGVGKGIEIPACVKYYYIEPKLPPQRTWVGLTDKDRYEFAAAQYGWEDLLIAAEAKLKDKNT